MVDSRIASASMCIRSTNADTGAIGCVSPVRLRQAVKEAGPMVEAVTQQLGE